MTQATEARALNYPSHSPGDWRRIGNCPGKSELHWKIGLDLEKIRGGEENGGGKDVLEKMVTEKFEKTFQFLFSFLT